MGVIPLPVGIKARSISTPVHLRRDDPEPTSANSNSVSKLVGLVLVLDDRPLEGEGLTRFEVGDVLGHLSGLSGSCSIHQNYKGRCTHDESDSRGTP
jgi:hypothetical protein